MRPGLFQPDYGDAGSFAATFLPPLVLLAIAALGQVQSNIRAFRFDRYYTDQFAALAFFQARYSSLVEHIQHLHLEAAIRSLKKVETATASGQKTLNAQPTDENRRVPPSGQLPCVGDSELDDHSLKVPL